MTRGGEKSQQWAACQAFIGSTNRPHRRAGPFPGYPPIERQHRRDPVVRSVVSDMAFGDCQVAKSDHVTDRVAGATMDLGCRFDRLKNFHKAADPRRSLYDRVLVAIFSGSKKLLDFDVARSIGRIVGIRNAKVQEQSTGGIGYLLRSSCHQ